MIQIFLTTLFYIFVAAFVIGIIAYIIVTTSILLANKWLLCVKFYTFFFEHDDWLLYKRAKKQGIQHYLNGYHLSQFCNEWNKVKDDYEVNNISAEDYLDEKTAVELDVRYKELEERYNYKEYKDARNSIKDDDIVLSLDMYGKRLFISVGGKNKDLLIWEPMVKDVIKSQINTRFHGYDNVYKLLLTNPKEVVSF